MGSRTARPVFASACLLAWVLLGPFACGSRTPLEPLGVVAETNERLRPPRDTQRIVFERVDQVDLLFVIDNSLSMTDKQELLKDAVPTLLERLINPPCISEQDRNDVVEVAGPGADCPVGYEKEFEPLVDLHVGVVTSSLGGHGGEICTPNGPNAEDYSPTEDDRAHLLATVRPWLGLASEEGMGFLAWEPLANSENNVDSFVSDFQDHVVGAGEVGCGYEATLEAWYRFLVEPNPYAEVVTQGGVAIPTGTDQELLTERESFMRPDSLLMVVVLSDENDCSIVDGGIGYLTAQAVLDGRQFNLPASTSACAIDPNDPCCRSCGLNESSPPRGCAPLAADSNCQAGRQQGTDALNLRCFNQKQRFGFDLLYPTERYVDALTEPTVYDTRNCFDSVDDDNPDADTRECNQVRNPLFSGTRDPSMLIYTAIVGVPWQDISTNESRSENTLEYLTARELEELGRWDVILGDPDAGKLPSDPLMIETPAVRTGENPITGEGLGAVDSQNPQENSINGHEYDNFTPDDLQYACIFPLETPRDCSTGQGACDCTDADLPKNPPVCNPPGGGPAGRTQYYAKAYPGVRHLQVARGLGEVASLASICPKVSAPPTSAPAYGYNPAANHMYERLSGGLGERCLSSPIPHADDGRAECFLWDLRRGNCDCEAEGLEPIDAQALASVQQMLEFQCRFQFASDCAGVCACQLPQFSGERLRACQNNALASGDGWCSVDPAQGVGSAQFVSDCRAGQPRTLRLLGRLEQYEVNGLFLTCPEG